MKGKVISIQIEQKGLFRKTPTLTQFVFHCANCGEALTVNKPSKQNMVLLRCRECWEPHFYYVSYYNIDIFSLKEEDIYHWQTPHPQEEVS